MSLIRQTHLNCRTVARRALAAATFFALALAASCTPPEASNNRGSDSAGIAGAPANAAKKPTVTVTQSRPGQQATPAPALESVPPDVWNAEIQAVDGKPFRLSDFKDKTIVLDIWATWCGPCRLEVPHLVELSKEYEGKGVVVIGLTTENPQTDEDKVRDFAKEFKINYKLGWGPASTVLPLMQGSSSIPQTFVIAPGGKILIKYRGYSPQLPSALRAAIGKAQQQNAAGD
jgi:thiol-disulfide isomerase/thioredoxin